jgi:hypothetical protein
MLDQGHLTADPVFVDCVERIDDATSRFGPADRPVPPGWRRAEGGGWVYLQHDESVLPPQGWKIHVSATAGEAVRVVDTVWEYCVTRGISFKFLRSAKMLALVNGKQAARSSGGKLVTIYPAAEELEEALSELGGLLRGVEGPYILSDLRWDEGPLYLRYGGFRMQYCFAPDGEYVPALTGPDGRLVPDVRGTSFRVPGWVKVPGFIEERVRAFRTSSSGEFPYRVEKALHFSNSGGVYRAVELRTGRKVVLREARPHAGLDNHGADAVARMAREEAMITRLAGLDVVPRLFGRVRHWEHHFLVEEFIEGEVLTQAIGKRHPLLYGSTDDVGAYIRWALEILGRIEDAVAQLHDKGVVFGDLQPENIMVRPDGGVCLVDFETAADVAEGFTPSLGTAGFVAPWARSGYAIDQYALACVRLAVFCPLTPLLQFDPDKPEELTGWVEERFPVPPEFGKRLREDLARPPAGAVRPDLARPPEAADFLGDTPAVLDCLRDAILATATPERTDRLFPGDVRQFDHQGASVAFGAAGVLNALHTTGRGDYPEFETHVDWLVRAGEATRWPRPGLYDGLGGIAVVLDRLGRPQQAAETLDRLRGFDLTDCGPALFGGLAGIALAFLHFGEVDQAVRLADRIRERARDTEPPADAKAGLMWGWSGPALLFTRLYAATGDEAYLRGARTALARDIARCGVSHPDAVQVRNGQGWIAAPDQGSVGIGLVLKEYLGHREDLHFARLLDRIRNGLGIELMLSPGLFDGHAGLLYGIAQLGGSQAVRDRHLRGLQLHTVRWEGGPAFGHAGLIRLSMDLASGAAGVLLAVHTARTAPTADPVRAAGSTAVPLPFLGLAP